MKARKRQRETEGGKEGEERDRHTFSSSSITYTSDQTSHRTLLLHLRAWTVPLYLSPTAPELCRATWPCAASEALLGHVPKTSTWLPVAVPPLSPWLAFWHTLPLKTQLLLSSAWSSAYFRSWGALEVLVSCSTSHRGHGGPEAVLQDINPEERCLCLNATQRRICSSSTALNRIVRKINTKINRATPSCGLSHSWVSRGWHSWERAYLSFPDKPKP